MLPWSPAGPFERRLEREFRAGATATCLALLREAELALPLPDGPPAWATVPAGDETWLPAYTSVPAMAAGTEGRARRCRVATLVELAAGWPDPRWRLAVNPGLPVSFALESGTVARLAVPGLAENKAAYPEALPPVLQKMLTPRDVTDCLHRGRQRVSGYVHQLLDVAGAGTPKTLLETLGESTSDLLSPQGSVTLLRWTALGSALYRSPYGGTDAERMAAVAGWIVEEPPFAGLGLGRNPDRVVREYKVDGAGLPHGAELWELAADGTQRRRAVLDADLGRWYLDGGVTAAGGADGTGRWWSYRASWRGREYDARPDQDGDELTVRLRRSTAASGFTEVVPGRHVRAVPVAECAEIAFVATACRWRGEPFQVEDERGDKLLIEYAGGQVPVARRLGLERVERGVHRARVPRGEVSDLRETRLPLDLAGR